MTTRRTGAAAALIALLATGLAWSLTARAAAPTADATGTLRIAVLAYRGSERAERRWATTADYLEQRIPGRRFEVLPMDLPALDRAVLEGGVDFAITHAGQFVRLGSRHGMRWLATLRSRRHPGRGPVIGSALLVRADAPYLELAGLEHATLGAVDPLAFGGFQIYRGELEAQGVRAERFFDEIRFSGFPVEALVYWVRDRQVDAAVVPACLLEQLGEEGLVDPDDFRVLDAREVPGFDCRTSSRLYPNWSFSALRDTPPALAAAVTQALLAMPADDPAARDAGSLGWTASVGSDAIHRLFQRLEIHPWQEPWWQGLQRWLRRNTAWGLSLLLLMAAGLGHHIWVQLQVQRRTRALQAANAALLDRQQELAHAQRVAILGELASGLAHELNQPLAAIHSYAEGGLVRGDAERRRDLPGLLERIRREARRGSDIIERIRDFARGETPPRRPTDLLALIDETCTLLDHELRRGGVMLRRDLPGTTLIARVDPVAIQQLLVNLMRNAIEAMAGTPVRVLTVAAQALPGGAVELRVADTGIGGDPGKLTALFEPFRSTKPGGLGLGLSISRRIAAAHGGEITLTPNDAGGLVARCILQGDADG